MVYLMIVVTVVICCIQSPLCSVVIIPIGVWGIFAHKVEMKEAAEREWCKSEKERRLAQHFAEMMREEKPAIKHPSVRYEVTSLPPIQKVRSRAEMYQKHWSNKPEGWLITQEESNTNEF